MALNLDRLDTQIPLTGLSVLELLLSLLVLAIGLSAAKFLASFFHKSLKRSRLSDLGSEFLARLLTILLYILVVLVFLSSLGVAVDSVVLGLSAVIGLILGFGMQDTVTNLTSGVWIAALRPMDINEIVEVAGHFGVVKMVGMMSTEIRTFDNQHIVISNRLIWGSPIINHSRMPTRRAAVDVHVSKKSDLQKAIRVCIDLMRSDPRVHDDPEPMVIVMSYGDSSVDLQLRAWTKTDDLWMVEWDLTAAVSEAFAENDIEIPFPQRDVHIKSQA